MAEQRTSTLWSLLVFVAVGSTVLSIMGSSSEVQGVSRACCLDNADCVELTRVECEDQQGGTSQTPGTTCLTADCPLLCGGSAPQCNGNCEEGDTCVQGLMARPGQGGGSFLPNDCECVPEIPQGGECDPQADACAEGLSCEDGVCCDRECGSPEQERCDLPDSVGVCTALPNPAPALSKTGLVVLVAMLVALGSLTLVRRRRHG